MVIACEVRNQTAKAEAGLGDPYARSSEKVLRLLNRDSQLRHIIVQQRWRGLCRESGMEFRLMYRRQREY
jgi:hypothetical protein